MSENNAAKTTQEPNQLEAQLELENLGVQELVVKAKELGIIVKTTDKSELIAAIIEAGVSVSSDKTEAGMQVGLHSKTDEAKALIQSARNAIVTNEQNGKYFNCFLKNQAGVKYRVRLPGVPVSAASLPRVLDIISTLPDGSQEETIKELKEHPENFKQPLLVRVRKKTGERTYQQFVMLYIERKSTQNVATTEL